MTNGTHYIKKRKKLEKLDNFGNVYTAVEWEKGPIGLYLHNSCHTTLSNKRALYQCEQRCDKEVEQKFEDADNSIFTPKRLWFSIGPVNDKTCCV